MKQPMPRVKAAPPVPTDERGTRGATEVAIQAMRQMILEGALSPGEQIRQQEMAEKLAVSRVPLREALNVLSNEGLLQHRLNSGYFVCKRTPSEARQLVRMLELLEEELLLTIDWPTAAAIKALRRMNEEMRVAVHRHDWSTLLQRNKDFHFAIFGLSPHKLILSELQRLWMLASVLIGQKISQPESGQRTVEEHEGIVDAIELRDRMLCRERIAGHRLSAYPPSPSSPPSPF